MYAYYIVRGHSKRELEELTYREKLFYIEAMALDIENENKKMEQMFGARQ